MPATFMYFSDISDAITATRCYEYMYVGDCFPDTCMSRYRLMGITKLSFFRRNQMEIRCLYAVLDASA